MTRTPANSLALTVVVVHRDHKGQLAGLLHGWRHALANRVESCEFLLVDDGSTDGSADLARRLETESPDVNTLRNPLPAGIGAALGHGIDAATTPLLLLLSAGPALSSSVATDLFALFDGVDFVSALRRAPPAPALVRGARAAWRLFVRVVFNITLPADPPWFGVRPWLRAKAARWLFGVRLVDPGSPCILIRRAMLERIPIQSRGPLAWVELAAKANFLGALMAEAPGELAAPTPFPAAPGEPGWATEVGRLFNNPQFRPQAVVIASS